MKYFILVFIPVIIITFAFCSSKSHKISGTITGGVGNPVINATISEKGTNNKNVATSDHLGRYSMRLSSPNATLVISSFKYKTVEIKVEGRKVVNVILESGEPIMGNGVITQ